MAPRTQYVTFDGRSLAFQIWGEGEREIAVVLNSANHLDWVWADPDVARIARHLGRIGRTVLYNQGGTGLSDPVVAPPSIEERADELLAVLDEAQMSRVDLFGAFDGAAIMTYVAATRPERVRSLLLVCPWVKGKDDGSDPPGITEWYWQEMEGVFDRWGEGASLDLWFPSLSGSPFHRRAVALLERSAAAPGTARSLAGAVRQLDVTAVLPAVGVPTLVIANKHDRILPIEQARYLAAKVAGSEMVEFDSADSSVQYEHLEAFLAAVSRFYGAQVDPGRSDCVFAALAFSDIVGSTAQLTRLGDQVWHGLLEAHDTATRRTIERHGGTEIQTTGDGFLVRFADAESAVRYGIDLVSTIRELGLEVRVGVHAGEVQHRAGDDVSGATVHVAARICATAGPNEVLVSQPVRELAASTGLNFANRGKHELRGAPGRWALHSAADRDPERIPETARLTTRTDRVQQAIIRHLPVVGRAGARMARRATAFRHGQRRPASRLEDA